MEIRKGGDDDRFDRILYDCTKLLLLVFDFSYCVRCWLFVFDIAYLIVKRSFKKYKLYSVSAKKT